MYLYTIQNAIIVKHNYNYTGILVYRCIGVLVNWCSVCSLTDRTLSLFSLRINSLTIPDNGYYQCRVRIPNDINPASTMNVQLLVLSPPKVSCDTVRPQGEIMIV